MSTATVQIKNAPLAQAGDRFAFVTSTEGIYGAWEVEVAKVGGQSRLAADPQVVVTTWEVEDLGSIVPGGVRRRFAVQAAARAGLTLAWGFVNS
jgi:hypothetical protein